MRLIGQEAISVDFSEYIDFNGQVIPRITLLVIRRRKILKISAAKSCRLLESRRFPIKLDVWGLDKMFEAVTFFRMPPRRV